MRISAGIIFIWAGTVATIPAGWVRDTDFDSKYLKGTANATNPNTTGGTATHSHTSPAHTHTAGAHVHVINLGTSSGTGAPTNNGTAAAKNIHTHATFNSGAVDNFSCSSVAGTYSSISNDPLYYSPIFITPSADTNSLPIGVICLADSEQKKLSVCDGADGTPNLVGKFLKGATAGANAGATGGSTTNIHNLTHTHTTTHNHAAATSAANTEKVGGATTANEGRVYPHTHTITPNAATPSTADTPSITNDETVEPAYTKLLAYQSKKIISLQPATIAMWKGTLANIPRGWILCDGTGGTVDMRDRHLKITATLAEVGDTGGSNTHTHASKAHTHANLAHTHVIPTVTHSDTKTHAGADYAQLCTTSVVHASPSTTSVSLVLSSANTTADSANNEPEYRTVAFIKSVNRLSGPAMFQLFVH